MDLREGSTDKRGWNLQSLVALALIFVAFRLADVAPSQAGSMERPREAAWTAHVRAVDDALVSGNIGAAERAAHEAYLVALASWRWDGLVDVAGAYLRIGQLSGLRQPAEAKARNLYLTALFRARQQDSLDGVLRAAEAFAALGDRDVAERCLRIAHAIAAEARDAEGSARVETMTARLVVEY